MKSLVALVVLGLFIPRVAAADTRWFSVAASSPDLSVVLGTMRSVGDASVELRVLRSDDCANFKTGFFVLVGSEQTDQGTASADAERWRERGVKDAYARRCDVRSNSLLALRVPFLDTSFLALRETPVNWNFKDVVARVEPLGADWVAIVAPYYVIAPDDVREGLRIGISIIELSSRKSIRLTDNCIDPKFVYSGKTLAMTCVTETAADNLLHKVMVFDLTTASILAERLRCRSPRVSETKWVCFEEHLDRAGILHLKQRRLP